MPAINPKFVLKLKKEIGSPRSPVVAPQPLCDLGEFKRFWYPHIAPTTGDLGDPGNHGKIVAIDIETGVFEVADDTIAATDLLYDRVPNAQPWVIRIGHRTVYRFGSRSLKKSV
jgi:hypothetical protein